MNTTNQNTQEFSDDEISLWDIYTRIKRRLALILGLTFVGLGLGIITGIVVVNARSVPVSVRVQLAFPGMEKSTYPNGQKFDQNDLIAPDVLYAAFQRLGITPNEKLLNSITVAPIISDEAIKARDKRLKAGEEAPPINSSEFQISINLPRYATPDLSQRVLLLNQIVNAYQEKFTKNNVLLGQSYGKAFEATDFSDFLVYEIILNSEIQTLVDFVNSQKTLFPNFRSSQTGLTFSEILKMIEIFQQVRVYNMLGKVWNDAFSKKKEESIMKLNYSIKRLLEQEKLRQDEVAVIQDLLRRSDERDKNYVFAKRVAQNSGDKEGQSSFDQQIVDALIAADTVNMLTRKALEAGLALTDTQNRLRQMEDRKKMLEAPQSSKSELPPLSDIQLVEMQKNLQQEYQTILSKVQICLEDFANQYYANAIRITVPAKAKSIYLSILVAGIIGAGACGSIATGLSILMPLRQRN